MEFEDWQYKVIRDALKLHYRLYRDEGGRKFSMHSLAADISAFWEDAGHFTYDENGAEEPIIKEEALRRFCNGTSPMGPERREAVFHYVTDPDRKILTVEELQSRNTDLRLPGLLLDYLDQDFDTERIPMPSGIKGTFSRTKYGGDINFKAELSVEAPSAEGVVKVSLAETYQYGDAMPKAEVKNKPDRVDRYVGWGVLTPEDYFLIFLKRKRNGQNLYLWALGSDLSHASSQSASYMALYNHTAPVTHEESVLEFGETIKNMDDYMKDGLTVYRRR